MYVCTGCIFCRRTVNTCVARLCFQHLRFCNSNIEMLTMHDNSNNNNDANTNSNNHVFALSPSPRPNLPGLTWPLKCRNSTGPNDPTLPRPPPPHPRLTHSLTGAIPPEGTQIIIISLYIYIYI